MSVPAAATWAPSLGSLAWALAEVERALDVAADLPGGSRLGDRPESFEDRRREDSLYGAAPYEVGDHPGAIRWRDYAVRDELLINVFETRSAEPAVLLLAEPSACLVRHHRLRDFAAWWLVALGRWSLGAGAAVYVGDDRPTRACRGVGQAGLVAERVGLAFHEARFDTLGLMPEWATVFVVSSASAAQGVVDALAVRACGRFGRVYALVAAEDLWVQSRRVRRTDGSGTLLDRPAGTVTRTVVEDAIAAGERSGVPVVPVLVKDAAADYCFALRRLAEGGPP